jgi:hypothetical protein
MPGTLRVRARWVGRYWVPTARPGLLPSRYGLTRILIAPLERSLNVARASR